MLKPQVFLSLLVLFFQILISNALVFCTLDVSFQQSIVRAVESLDAARENYARVSFYADRIGKTIRDDERAKTGVTNQTEPLKNKTLTPKKQ